MVANLYSSGIFANQANNGQHPWPNLAKLDAELLSVAPDLVVSSISAYMDMDVDYKAAEAIIRRIWTEYPTCRQLFVIIPKTDASYNVLALDESQTAMIALFAHYGIPTVSLLDYCIAHPEETESFTETGGGVHLAEAGETKSVDLMTAYFAANPTFLTTSTFHTLPARVTDCADYEHPSQHLNPRTDGTETGSGWADVGTTGRESSTEGDTIAFTATFTSFGFLRLLSSGVEMDVKIDDGAFVAMNLDTNGYPTTLGRAEHTVTFRVRAGTTLRIDEFPVV